ncbi:ribosome biogenesis GTPase Der [Candidatus Ishikawella capsulata]|uniref:GTPase Der n=1 Tax=Candidatus Ishikawaella capsulata Mpkobe TaxID=476281 RepID=C5WC85_9ENTR|nr:ribosome biogenesis GTPase Der [Candidatus Ishikawaella capsulata]BAH82941.1 GTP-binding protein EngA [Candidatus Ishikawaella capsulata Mpkobe]
MLSTIIALVGRPNVGKSTLFNCLTGTRDALVLNSPGLTRDLKYGKFTVKGFNFVVIDTGGIEDTTDGIETEVVDLSLSAIDEADIIFFMVDAQTGLMPTDKYIAHYLYKNKKTTFLIVNKVDEIAIPIAITEFYELGFTEIYPITASHNRGILNILEKALIPWINNSHNKQIIKKNNLLFPQNVYSQKQLSIQIAIVGRPNVGKSTIANRIAGKNRVIVSEIPGTTRDSISIPIIYEKRDYIIIDTAGVRNRNKRNNKIEHFSVIKTMQSIEQSNVIILVVDAVEGIIHQDICLLNFIFKSGKPLVIVINKWDMLNKKNKILFKEILNHRLYFAKFIQTHFISALHGMGMQNLFKSVREAYESSTKHINTSILTRIMYMAKENNPPPLIHGRRIKLKYAHAGGYSPPIVVIHGNQTKNIPESYKRYLIKYFRLYLNIKGTPIRIQFKEAPNPFIEKSKNCNFRKKKRRCLTKF